MHEGNFEDDQNIMHQHTTPNEPTQSGDMALENRQVENDDNSNEEEEQIGDGVDHELVKRLSKQRQRAIRAAHGGRRAITSRNSYKDKGGRSSHNSKIQKQLNGL